MFIILNNISIYIVEILLIFKIGQLTKHYYKFNEY